MRNSPGPLEKIYELLLRAYPPEYIDTFGDEMHHTFLEGLNDAKSNGDPDVFIQREILDLPKSLLNAYWQEWKGRLLGGIQTVQMVMSTSDLPPAPPDGRESWRQVLWEISLFLIAGGLLIVATYLQPGGLPPGWQRSPEFMGRLIVPLTAPFFILGLARGLPRWSYPIGGLLLSYYGFVSNQSSLWLFIVAMLLAASMLALAAILTDPQPSRLPVAIRRMGQSLSLDGTRLSFGLYGAMPLLILMAFDDSHYNNRTPYLALSLLAMILSALIYCRSRSGGIQIVALLLGITLSIWGASLDKISFANGLMNWVIISSPGNTDNLWLLKLWVQWMVLISFPVIPMTLARVMKLKRAV